MSLIRHESSRNVGRSLLRKKTEYIRSKSGYLSSPNKSALLHDAQRDLKVTTKEGLGVTGTKLMMSSRVSYFSDAIITPEMVRTSLRDSESRCVSW